MFGQGNFNTTANIPPGGIADADNGLSVDSGTGKAVLGSDTGTTAGELLSDREIVSNGRGIKLSGAANADTFLFAGDIELTDNVNLGQPNTVQMFAAPDSAVIFIRSDTSLGTPPRVTFSDPAGGGGTIDQATTSMRFYASLASVGMVLDFLGGLFQIGDLTNFSKGLKLTIDDANDQCELTNTATNAKFAVNGTPGVTGIFTPVTSITVVGGIVTAVT